MTKQCVKCLETKPINEFYKDKTNKDGHNSWCKVCCKARSKLSKYERYQKRKTTKDYYSETPSIHTTYKLDPNDYDIVGNCWIWKRGTNGIGYPIAHIDGKSQLVTRWLKRYELEPGQIVRHAPGICHNPSCINPDHLIVGTRKENMADREIDKTNTFTQTTGTTHLTQKQVIEIYLRLLKGESPAELAREFNKHKSTIGDIKNGKTWGELTEKVRNKLRRMREERKKGV